MPMNFRKLLAGAAMALGIVAGGQVQAAGEAPALVEIDWPQDGPFGHYDRASVQRGFQVFTQVCAACHAAKYFTFRTLEGVGYNEDQIKAIAASFTVTDGPNDAGEMFERPGRPSDHKPKPFANEQQARAANGGAYPLDLSLITKAREDGDNYVYSILIGYEDPPAGFTVPTGMNYNKYFPGHLIGMPPPLNDDQVAYTDGTKATRAQMAMDVTQFLAWLAEPKMEERKQTGIKVIIFLVILTGLLYAYKRKVWAKLH